MKPTLALTFQFIFVCIVKNENKVYVNSPLCHLRLYLLLLSKLNEKYSEARLALNSIYFMIYDMMMVGMISQNCFNLYNVVKYYCTSRLLQKRCVHRIFFHLQLYVPKCKVINFYLAIYLAKI